MTRERLLLGVDGGGTGTKAVVARAAAPGVILGHAYAGPGNLHTHGALGEVERAIQECLQSTGIGAAPVSAACLALAGIGCREDREHVHRWARERSVAERVTAVADAVPVLARVALEGPGVALISGTGSVAFGKKGRRIARAGGLGARFGDEGSGYAIAVEALRRVALAADGRHPPVTLTERLLAHLDLRSPRDLLASLGSHRTPPDRVAGLAPLVLQAAEEGDAVATLVVEQAAGDLARLVTSVCEKLQLAAASYELALAGGVLLHGVALRERLLSLLEQHGRAPRATVLSDHPAEDCLRIAHHLLENRWNEEEWSP